MTFKVSTLLTILNEKTQLQHRIDLLSQPEYIDLLAQGLRGIEREGLRVNPDGQMNVSAHPIALGSALTHPQITTDYSESLLEFITPAEHSADIVLQKLEAIHRFTYKKIGSQMLWSQSMPCELPNEADIPIAWYGISHIGMLKHVYRRGLALRYGKAMQCIAGIHYNFSLSETVWTLLQKDSKDHHSAQDFQSESYVATIRNFQRYSWLLMYLFGASPALSKGFLSGREHDLEVLSDDTLFLPYATSLRMSDLGYQNNAQDGLVPPYNTLTDYMYHLSKAVRKPYPPYERLGTKSNGEWVQINTNILQIENEFYATIRPKREIRLGERPVEALCDRGVQYIEVRCMDIDPYEPIGISLQTTRFLDAFLLFCALNDSPQTNVADGQSNTENFARTVKQGRRQGLLLKRGEHAITLKDWGLELIAQITPVAELLDAQHGGTEFTDSLAVQKDKLLYPEHTPSARVLNAIRENGNSFTSFAVKQSAAFAEYFREQPLGDAENTYFENLAEKSLMEQTKMEATQVGSFDLFIENYRTRALQNAERDAACQI